MLHDSLMASTRAQVLYTGQKFPIGKNAPYENRSLVVSLAASTIPKRLMHFVQRVLYFYKMWWQEILDLQNDNRV